MTKVHHSPSSDEQETLANVSARMTRLEEKIDALQSHPSEKDKEDARSENSSSKLVTGGVIGLIGMKLGALIGAKVGAGSSLANIKWMDSSGLPGIRKVTEWVGKKTAGNAMLKEMGLNDPYMIRMLVNGKVYALAGAALVGIPAAIFGYQRGDRLNKATDLIAKPFDSFHRLTQSEESFVKEHPKHHLSEKAPKKWTEKLDDSRSQSEQSAGFTR